MARMRLLMHRVVLLSDVKDLKFFFFIYLIQEDKEIYYCFFNLLTKAFCLPRISFCEEEVLFRFFIAVLNINLTEFTMSQAN